MTKLHLLKDGVPVNAAMLLFSKSNLLYNVHIGHFKTPSLIIADNMVNGNLYDVVDESMRIIVSHLKFAFEITGKTTQRTEIPEYPLEAIREMLLNAVIHRNYQSSTDIQIKIFDQKIVFFNPSGLYGDITVDELKTDNYTASTRNKLIAEAFYLTNDIEKYGSGFTRIREAIVPYPTMKYDFYMMENGCFSELSYERQKISTAEIEDSGLKDSVEKTVEKIVEAIKVNPFIIQKELVKITGLSRRGVEWNLQQLRKNEIILRVGPAKGGHWEINKETE